VNRRRRSLLAALGASLTLAGCTEESADEGGNGGNGGTRTGRVDSDGDGVPDESDYAPRDPDVQSENDVSSDGSDGSGSESGTDSDSGGDDSGGDGGGDTGDFAYPSHSGRHTITARDNYWAWEFSVPERFALSYRVTNLRDENYDFDVLLYDPERFNEYRAIATEREDGIRPQYIDGSAPGVTSGVSGTVDLPAGTYYLVVDNTDLSDAGDWGTEDTREVSVQAETRAP
jgi:hypothetical protein